MWYTSTQKQRQYSATNQPSLLKRHLAAKPKMNSSVNKASLKFIQTTFLVLDTNSPIAHSPTNAVPHRASRPASDEPLMDRRQTKRRFPQLVPRLHRVSCNILSVRIEQPFEKLKKFCAVGYINKRGGRVERGPRAPARQKRAAIPSRNRLA